MQIILYLSIVGEEDEIEGHTYEENLSSARSSHFVPLSQKWSYTSMGVYMDKSDANCIATNALSLNMIDPDFYQTAHVAHFYLKYYTLCMLKGRYKVGL